jgi:hypothetical protein
MGRIEVIAMGSVVSWAIVRACCPKNHAPEAEPLSSHLRREGVRVGYVLLSGLSSSFGGVLYVIQALTLNPCRQFRCFLRPLGEPS